METPIGHPLPRGMQAVYESIVRLTDPFCAAYLDAEYAPLARKMAAALSGCDPSPLVGGGAQGWAAGIVYHLCQVNHLFCMTHPGWIAPKRVAGLLGVSPSTAMKRAREIRRLLATRSFDPRWTAPGNPLAWRLFFDGVALDVRLLPREAGEALFENGSIAAIPTPRPGIPDLSAS